MNMQPVNKTPGKSARIILNAPALNVYSDAINSDIALYKIHQFVDNTDGSCRQIPEEFEIGRAHV